MTNADAWSRVLEHSHGDATWISGTSDMTEKLLRAVTVFAASHHGTKRRFGDLLMLQSPKTESLPALHTLFRNVIGQVGCFRMLPWEELAEVLLAPNDEGRDLFIGGSFDPGTETLTLTRGDFDTVVVPVSLFRPSGEATARPSELAITDFGHTVQLGDYEASADAILYEIDPEYRRRLSAKRRQEEKGFGASLRRLRVLRRLKRSDFPGIAAKTIARIERSETDRPHGKTLHGIAKTLGVAPDDIESY